MFKELFFFHAGESGHDALAYLRPFNGKRTPDLSDHILRLVIDLLYPR